MKGVEWSEQQGVALSWLRRSPYNILAHEVGQEGQSPRRGPFLARRGSGRIPARAKRGYSKTRNYRAKLGGVRGVAPVDVQGVRGRSPLIPEGNLERSDCFSP